MEWQPCYLAGRCHDGAQKDGGTLWHAVPVTSWKALCGAEPGRRSAGWAPWDESERVHEVTCPRCKKVLAKRLEVC